MSTAVAFAIPLLPGKTEQDKAAMRSCRLGDHRADYEASRKRLGITSESVWLQTTPTGTVAVVHLVADNLQTAFTGLATSEDPFDHWFRNHCLEVHGIDLREGFPPPEQILAYTA
jgi:hypothetical protein